MTMAPIAPDKELTRPVFARLRNCRDKWEKQFGATFPRLSMGMSGDFEVAVEEGAEEGTVTVLYENGAGYFSFLDGILYWTGAEDEYHSQCEFQKI